MGKKSKKPAAGAADARAYAVDEKTMRRLGDALDNGTDYDSSAAIDEVIERMGEQTSPFELFRVVVESRLLDLDGCLAFLFAMYVILKESEGVDAHISFKECYALLAEVFDRPATAIINNDDGEDEGDE